MKAEFLLKAVKPQNKTLHGGVDAGRVGETQQAQHIHQPKVIVVRPTDDINDMSSE